MIFVQHALTLREPVNAGWKISILYGFYSGFHAVLTAIDACAVAEDDGLGGLNLDKKKKKKKKPALMDPVSIFNLDACLRILCVLSHLQSCQMCSTLSPASLHADFSMLQDAAPTGEAEEAAEDDAEAAQGLDLSLTKKKKKKKTKARTDDEFGAMVEDAEGMPAEGESSLLEY